MLIIGEKLNSSIPQTLDALNRHDEAYIVQLIERQSALGADYLDINTALTGEKEIENMLWVIRLAIAHSSCGIMIDSPNPDVIAQCVPQTGNRPVMVNSITLESKYDALLGIIQAHDAGVVCLPLRNGRIPHSPGERLENAMELAQKLTGLGIPAGRIFIDVLVEAIASGESAAVPALHTIRLIKGSLEGVRTLCGLSNVSFGLPNRARLNSAFLAMALASGLDSAIIDITSEQIRNTLFAGNALLGNDEYCLDYINFCRAQTS